MTTYNLFPDTPQIAADPETNSLTLGTEFYVTQAGCTVTQIRALVPSINGGTEQRIGALYRVIDATSGTMVAGPFTLPAGSAGTWATFTLPTPYALEATARYRVAILHPGGRYAAQGAYFTTGPGGTSTTQGPVVLPSAASALGNRQGSYFYEASIGYPNNTFQGASYFSDVTIDDNAITSNTGTLTAATPRPAGSLTGTQRNPASMTASTPRATADLAGDGPAPTSPIISSGVIEYPAGSEATTYVLPITGAQPGDILVVAADSNVKTATITGTPSGSITLVPHAENPYGNHAGSVYAWPVPASPPASITWTWSTAVRGNLTWTLIRGHVLDDVAVSASAWTNQDESPTAPAVTAAQGALVLGGLGAGSGSIVVTPGAGWTTLAEAGQRRGYLASKGVVAAGSTGVAQFSLSSPASGNRLWQAAFAPVSASSVLQNAIVGVPTDQTVTMSARTSGATSVRLKVGTNAAVTSGVAWSAPVTPDSAGWAKLTAAVSADTQYWYAVEMTSAGGTTLGSIKGPVRSAPTPGTPTTFDVVFGGDVHVPDQPAAFNNMAARNAAFVFSTGDTHAADNTSSSQASHRQDWENIWQTNAAFKALIEGTPFAQSFGDHDQGGGNNSVPGPWTAPNIAAYQQVLPTPPSPHLPNTTNWAFTWGRVRFISPDWGHERTASTKLGSAQKTWLGTELSRSEPLKVLLVGGVWYDAEAPEGWPDGDGWADYAAHRAEITTMISAAPGLVLGVHGDQHALAAMTGAGNPYGGFPVVGASPWSGYSSHKGDVTPDTGRWPTTVGVQAQQYGRLSFTDAGGQITVVYRGYDSTNTQRVTLTATTPTAPNPGSMSATTPRATSTLVGVASNTAALAAAAHRSTATIAGASTSPGTLAGVTPQASTALTGQSVNKATLTVRTPAPTLGVVGASTSPATLSAPTPSTVVALAGTSTNPAVLAAVTSRPTASGLGTATNAANLSASTPLATANITDAGTEPTNPATLNAPTHAVAANIPGDITNPGSLTAATLPPTAALPGETLNPGSLAATAPRAVASITESSVNPGSLAARTPPATSSIVATLRTPATLDQATPHPVAAILGASINPAHLTTAAHLPTGWLPGAARNPGTLTAHTTRTDASMGGTATMLAILAAHTILPRMAWTDVLRVTPDCRTWHIPAETRTYRIAREDRTYRIGGPCT